MTIPRLLDGVGDKETAVMEYRRFLELWKHADADRSELAETRRAIVRLTNP